MTHKRRRERKGYFNSRPSARGDAHLCAWSFPYSRISIHAPPRGATWRTRWLSAGTSYFNSRPSARGDKSSRAQPGRMEDFNSRPSARGDKRPAPARQTTCDFNSRPSARGDAMRGDSGTPDDISIHAPPRGATAKDMQFLQIFCSTLTNQHGLTIVPRNLSRLFW